MSTITVPITDLNNPRRDIDPLKYAQAMTQFNEKLRRENKQRQIEDAGEKFGWTYKNGPPKSGPYNRAIAPRAKCVAHVKYDDDSFPVQSPFNTLDAAKGFAGRESRKVGVLYVTIVADGLRICTVRQGRRTAH